MAKRRSAKSGRSKGHGCKLSTHAPRVVAALLAGLSREAACRNAGISPATLARWSRLAEFQELLEAGRREVVTRTADALVSAALRAVMSLRRNLRCGHGGTEVRAAAALLDHARPSGTPGASPTNGPFAALSVGGHQIDLMALSPNVVEAIMRILDSGKSETQGSDDEHR